MVIDEARAGGTTGLRGRIEARNTEAVHRKPRVVGLHEEYAAPRMLCYGRRGGRRRRVGVVRVGRGLVAVGPRDVHAGVSALHDVAHGAQLRGHPRGGDHPVVEREPRDVAGDRVRGAVGSRVCKHYAADEGEGVLEHVGVNGFMPHFATTIPRMTTRLQIRRTRRLPWRLRRRLRRTPWRNE